MIMQSLIVIAGVILAATIPFAEQAFAYPGCMVPCPPRSGGAELAVFGEFLAIAGFGLFLMFYWTSRYNPRKEVRA